MDVDGDMLDDLLNGGFLLESYASERSALNNLSVNRSLQLAAHFRDGEGRLWFKDGSPSLGTYAELFGVSRRYADVLLRAGRIAKEIERLEIQQPTNAGQLMPLLTLLNDPDALRGAWVAAVKMAGGGAPSRAIVRQVSFTYPPMPATTNEEPVSTQPSQPTKQINLKSGSGRLMDVLEGRVTKEAAMKEALARWKHWEAPAHEERDAYFSLVRSFGDSEETRRRFPHSIEAFAQIADYDSDDVISLGDDPF